MNRHQGTSVETNWLITATTITILATIFHALISWFEYWVICDFAVQDAEPYWDVSLSGYVCRLHAGILRSCFQYGPTSQPASNNETTIPGSSYLGQVTNRRGKISCLKDADEQLSIILH